MKGTIAVPIRLEDGTLVGYIGIEDARLPPKWQLPMAGSRYDPSSTGVRRSSLSPPPLPKLYRPKSFSTKAMSLSYIARFQSAATVGALPASNWSCVSFHQPLV
jgi:hypothetical protein